MVEVSGLFTQSMNKELLPVVQLIEAQHEKLQAKTQERGIDKQCTTIFHTCHWLHQNFREELNASVSKSVHI